jgi:hypothetical protein
MREAQLAREQAQMVKEAVKEEAARLKALEADFKTQQRLARQEAVKEQKERQVEMARLRRDLQAEKNSRTTAITEAILKQREKIAAEAQQSAQVAFQKRERGLESLIAKLKADNDNLQRRVERLSSHDRGDFNEEDFTASLQRAYPLDHIARVGTGRRGLDIVHEVRYESDGETVTAGTIVYECKDTARWLNTYLTQVKEASTRHRTPYLVLVSRCLPPREQGVCVRDSVIIADFACALTISGILRRLVIDVDRSARLAGFREKKTELLLDYLSGADFKQNVRRMIDVTEELVQMLTKERESHRRVWDRREDLYHEILEATAGVDERVRSILERAPTKRVAQSRERRIRAAS